MDIEQSFSSLFTLSLLSAIIPVLFLLGFSGLGYGLDVVTNSQDYHDETSIGLGITGALILFMYIFDLQYWPVSLQILSWSSIFVTICVALCLLVSIIPYGPICVFTILMPLSIFGIKNVFFPKVPANVLVGWNHNVYIYMASIITVVYFYWCSKNGNMWDAETDAEYSNKAGCAVDFTDLEECENADAKGIPCFFDQNHEVISFSKACPPRCIDVYQECEEAFIIWANPGLAAMSLFVIGFISKYLKEPEDPHANYQVSGVAKFSAVFLFLFWIFASLAGAGDGLSSSLIAFAISMFIGSCIIFSLVFWNSLVTRKSEDIVGGVTKQVSSYKDLFRGLAVLGFSPLIIVYLFISIVKQFVRRMFTRHFCQARVPEAEYQHAGVFTLSVASQIEDFFTWDHVKILSYGVYWGVGYVFLNVLASKFTTVFLSWLIEYTSSMNVPAVTGIVIAVGLVLFMLPPIPGLPIYLTSGIVLVSVGRDTFGLWGAIAYASVVSLSLKLMACAVQQKLIGGNLGDNVGVKQMVSINSEGIRAMRVMLSDSGITARKVAVLVGGPDWPVSVLCGILGLDLLPLLIGTLPVVILIVPTVLCGSFAFMGSLETEEGTDMYPWADTMGAVVSSIAAGAMFYFTLAAAGAIKDTLQNEKEVIESIPLDEDVKQADEVAAKKKVSYERATVWSSVPFVMKLILILALLAMMGCCYLLVVFNSQCFREYDLMYTISEHLGGDWTNIVLPLGRIALLLFVISYALLYVFESWATNMASKLLESEDEGETAALTKTEAPSYNV